MSRHPRSPTNSGKRPGWPMQIFARAIQFTGVVDRASAAFDRWRSRVLLRFAPDRFFDAYNDAAYRGQTRYQSGSGAFRAGLFGWERQAIAAFFPPAPATILVGGAGGGREALALARLGYRVVAFDPVAELVAALGATTGEHGIEVLRGRYADLPTLSTPSPPTRLRDLSAGARFDAAILGWSSFSHLRTDAERQAALASMAALTNGPVLLSYYAAASRGAADKVGREWFAIGVGYAREVTPEDMRAFARGAGLTVVHIDHDGAWPHAVLTST